MVGNSASVTSNKSATGQDGDNYVSGWSEAESCALTWTAPRRREVHHRTRILICYVLHRCLILRICRQLHHARTEILCACVRLQQRVGQLSRTANMPCSCATIPA